MGILSNLNPQSVFKHFEEICAIPHGSGDMEKIADYCMDFARENNLSAVVDEAKNVIIYKDGTKGYENSAPLILQGHLDMVCQKTEERIIDFEKDGIELLLDGDFIKAKDTTLGADNGIAVAMIIAILESTDIPHPPLEAVFTTDEEIGMIGANKLDIKLLNGKRMINLDSEEDNVLTVSCAGGRNVDVQLDIKRKNKTGTSVLLKIDGLQGGHSGIDIGKGRVNADTFGGRVLSQIKKAVDFDIISVNGGTKINAIPMSFTAELSVKDTEKLISYTRDYFNTLKAELKDREKDIEITLQIGKEEEVPVLDSSSRDKLIYMLSQTPNGVVDMSAVIENLVETSLNLGIVKTQEDKIIMQYGLRSNKKSALDCLEDKMVDFAQYNECEVTFSDRYDPWEYKENSTLRQTYTEVYENIKKSSPIVTAIHAGLECAVFSSRIDDIDCISIGPNMFDVHTVKERLSISSTKETFELLCNIIAQCK